MKNLRRILGISVAILALALPGLAADLATDAIYSMPSSVMTEGLTVNEHIAYQAQLAADLLADLPSARLRQVRVALSDDELAAIDNGDRSSTPLQIGLVKPIPGVEISGLTAGASARQPRRGALGIVSRTQDGDFVWAASVQAERAGAIRLHLEDFSLPEGAELYVYTRDGEAYGPYTGMGPDGSGEFWVTTVFGSEAILQLQVPKTSTIDALGEVSFKVTEIGVITEKFTGAINAASGFCGNASCILDACQVQNKASSIWNAYAKMEWVSGAYIYTCTGGLLSDTDTTKDHYFLTANHCFSSSKTAKNVTFYWWFRDCGSTSCPSNNGWPYKSTGGSVAATNRKGDFTLVKLIGAPPAGSTFLGWTNAAVANTNGVALHRVSNPQFGPQVYNEQTVSTSAGVCRGWPRGERIYSRDTLGGTDGGSSGSPVVMNDGSNLVVGQLSGACGTNVNDPCDSTNNATVDGAFAYYFATVKPFLQP